MNAQTKKLMFCLSMFLFLILGSGIEDSVFLGAKDSARVLQVYTDAQIQKSPYADPTWASYIINYKSNWPLTFAQSLFNGQDCTSFVNQWKFETYYVNHGFIYSTVAQKYLALRLIGSSYQLVAESTVDASAQQWTIENPNNDSPLPLGWVHVTQVRNGQTYALTQLYFPPDNGVQLSPTATLPVGVQLLDTVNNPLSQQWNFHAAGTVPPANYPTCSVAIKGYLKDANSNLVIPSSDLTATQPPVVSFTGSGRTFVATVDPTTSIYSIQLPTGTYSYNVVVSQYQSKAGTMTFMATSDQTNSANTIFLIPLTATLSISGYLKDALSNTVFSSSILNSRSPSVTFYGEGGASFAATIDLVHSIYKVMVPAGIYSMTATIKGYFPKTSTVTLSVSSDQTNSANTISFELATWHVTLDWYNSFALYLNILQPDGNYASFTNPHTSSLDISFIPGRSDSSIFHNLYALPGTYEVVVTDYWGWGVDYTEATAKLYKGTTLVSTLTKGSFWTGIDNWHLWNIVVTSSDDESYTEVNTFY